MAQLSQGPALLPEVSRAIAKRIIEFADGPRPDRMPSDKTLIVSEYERLKERISR